ncbi:hypothetical protein [Microbulbifer aggregans]|uniref:hypothetical protein n=1 Tax=Microbulbifer aggregans TaxID=1769779 RepID=UPI001CFF45F9|nr:hypothetical protein [Microbulbifer aggregans]
MLKVHVWLPLGNMVGHASLSFGSDYVSFWPEDSAGKKDLKIKRSHPGQFMTALKEDVLSEGGRQPITVTIQRVDEEGLSKFIAELISNVPRYQLARYNCSHVVAECLKVACGKTPSFKPSAREYGRLGGVLGLGIWTPSEVLRYARELSVTGREIA